MNSIKKNLPLEKGSGTKDMINNKNFKNSAYNTDNKGNLFVTVFALAPTPKTDL
jgi:hypothetical protein